MSQLTTPLNCRRPVTRDVQTLLLGIISRHVIDGGGVFIFSQYILIVSRQSMVYRSTFISERQRTDGSTTKHMEDSADRNSYMYIVVYVQSRGQ